MKKPAILIACCIAIMLFLVLAIHPRPGFPIHIPMHILFFVLCLIMLFVGVSIMQAQAKSTGQNHHGFIGPGINPPPQGGPGFGTPPPPPGVLGFVPPLPPGHQGQYGFTGPSRISTTAQALTFEHRSPVILSGNLVQSVGADLYTFRDSSGEITVRIGPPEWQNTGFNISPSDNIEISGEVHRDELGFTRASEVHARFIRKI